MSKRGQTITKRALAEGVASKVHKHSGETLHVVQAVLDEIVEQLAEGNRLELRDFGVFELVSRKPRTALNPKTLEKVAVQERVVVKFKPGRRMKAEVAKLDPSADGSADASADISAADSE